MSQTPRRPIKFARAADDHTAVHAATEVAGLSFISVWPFGEDRPDTSNLNLVPGQTIANLVICRLGEGGALTIANELAECHVIADVLGYFVA